MNVPMLALRREHAVLDADLSRLWAHSLEQMHLLNGPHVAAFEEEIAEYAGSKDAVAVASGTDALALGLIASGISEGDEVIVQANGFAADIEAIRIAGGRPVVVDIDPSGRGPDLEAVRDALGPRTRGILAVHLHGDIIEMSPLMALAEEHGLALVEDASHAHGARLDGQHAGTFGTAGAFSAGVVKNLGAYGDAGFVLTSTSTVAEQVRLLRAHGQSGKNHHVVYGFNSRMDELQAAVLRSKLPLLDERNSRRRKYASHYTATLRGLCMAVPEPDSRRLHAFHQYVIRVAGRDTLRARLSQDGIETGVHYPVPLHLQPAYKLHYANSPSCTRAEAWASQIVSLPIVPDLTWAEVQYVAERVQHHLS